MRPFHVEQFLGDSCPTAMSARWFRLGRYFLRRAAVEQHRDDARDAAAAACECRSIAASCWQIALQRQGEPPPRVTLAHENEAPTVAQVGLPKA